MVRFQRLAGVALAATLLFGAARFAAASTIPYSQNFDSIAVGGTLPDETQGTNGSTTSTWGVVDAGGGNHVYQNVLTGGKGFDSLQFPALGGAANYTNFEVSTLLKPVGTTSPGSVNYTEGLRFLASVPGDITDSYAADLNVGVNASRMRPSSSGLGEPLPFIPVRPKRINRWCRTLAPPIAISST